MYKTINHLLFIFIFSFVVETKADQLDAIIEMSVEEMKKDADFKGMTNCLGVAQDKFLKVFRKTMRYCMDKHGFSEQAEIAMDICFNTQTEKGLGISSSVFNKCKAKYPDNESDKNSDEMDYSNMSQQEIAEQMEIEQQQAKEVMESAIAMSHAMSKGTEDQVTLPVYPSSQIISHFTQGMINEDNPQALPVAMFYSPDSLAKIIAFYDSHLARFDKKKFDGNMVVYMMNMADDFEPSTDMDAFQKSPHITLYPFMDEKGEQKISIEIAYKK